MGRPKPLSLDMNDDLPPMDTTVSPSSVVKNHRFPKVTLNTDSMDPMRDSFSMEMSDVSRSMDYAVYVYLNI